MLKSPMRSILRIAAAACLAAPLALAQQPASGPPAALPNSTLTHLFAPEFSAMGVAWIAAAIVLALLVQARPLLSLRNLDALVLALLCLTFPLRTLGAVGVAGDASGHSVQFYSYLALSLFAAYWLLRGIGMVFARRVTPRTAGGSAAGLSILAIAAFALGLNALFTQPVSTASRYAIAGGMYFRDTGKLPYGELLGHDTESPLNYLLHAGATKLAPPVHDAVALTWSNRDSWLTPEQLADIDLTAGRIVNGVLFVLLFVGVACLGKRLHSVSMGKTVAALACALPLTQASLTDTSIMLPAVLLAWGLATTTIPGVGLLLGTFLIVMAGFAWPWAWLVLLPLLAYASRRGWQAFGAVIGALGGSAACAAITYAFVAPALPRPDRAIAAVGARPQYTATLSGNQLIIEKWPESQPATASDANAAKKWLWNRLLDADTASMRGMDQTLTLPAGVDPSAVWYRDISASPAALPKIQPLYQEAVNTLPDGQRLLISIRTLLESVWLAPEHHSSALPPVWDVWFGGGSGPDSTATITLVRRIAKGAVGFIAVVLAVMLLRRENPTNQALLGAVLATTVGIALCSSNGAVSDAVWWIPALLGAIAAGGEPAASPLFSRPGVRGAAPEHDRITVE